MMIVLITVGLAAVVMSRNDDDDVDDANNHVKIASLSLQFT